ncbi:MAG: fibronectin type III domain-containing protein [Candidatus Nanopelagicales bacterium]|nr:fibronectin type III domain-containing protein [Candidatus Nanopelagicales bacterium]
MNLSHRGSVVGLVVWAVLVALLGALVGAPGAWAWPGGDTPPDKTLVGAATGLNSPGDVAFDGSGRMYVTNYGGDSVTVYSADWADGDTGPVKTLAGAATGLNAPVGVAFDGDWNMYVTNWDGGSVTVYSASATVPGAARSVGGVAGDGRATVSWTAPASTGGSAVTGYRIQRRAGSGSWSTVVGNTGSVARSRVVTGLSNGTSYTFRVAAINSVGVGAFSPASAAVKPVGKPGKPGKPKVKAKRHGKARIHWAASASHGGKVTYKIQRAVKKKHGKWRKVASTTRHKWNGKVPGAKKAARKGRALWFRIVPHNSAGTGPKSKHTKAWMKK